MGRNTRAAGQLQVRVAAGAKGRVQGQWEKDERWRAWAELSEGCHLPANARPTDDNVVKTIGPHGVKNSVLGP